MDFFLNINITDLVWFLVKQNCEGCKNNCLSQKYHSVCFDSIFIEHCHNIAEKIILEYGAANDIKKSIRVKTEVSDPSTNEKRNNTS